VARVAAERFKYAVQVFKLVLIFYKLLSIGLSSYLNLMTYLVVPMMVDLYHMVAGSNIKGNSGLIFWGCLVRKTDQEIEIKEVYWKW
jgi:hypothetical protein